MSAQTAEGDLSLLLKGSSLCAGGASPTLPLDLNYQVYMRGTAAVFVSHWQVMTTTLRDTGTGKPSPQSQSL